MSLLEDIFLQDEADEAQELERVIEGDEYDERPHAAPSDSDENSEKDDEAIEDKTRVDPTKDKTKRVVKNPRFILNPARLTGPRGIQIIPEHFKDFKFKGKGNEKEDLDFVLKKLEHWAYRLYPKFQFEDCLKKIETLGKKRPVMVHLQKIRSDQLVSDEIVVQKDSSDDETPAPPQEEDEFDKLLQQQIELARATPAPGSVKKPGFVTPGFDKRSTLTVPKATSSPSISDEQKERIIRNRKLAEERRLSRLKQNSGNENNIDLTENNTNASISNDLATAKRHNRSNVIDSSDEESEITYVNQSISVDIHANTVNGTAKIDDTNNKIITNIDDPTENRFEIVSNDDPIIDLVNIQGSQDSDGITAEKRNRSNVIGSSDEESNAISVNQSINVDIHDSTVNYGNTKNNDTNDKVTIIDDSTETGDTGISNEVPIIDLVYTHAQGNKDSDDGLTAKNNNGSNVIDSSDEECELASINQAITVDLHYNTLLDDDTQKRYTNSKNGSVINLNDIPSPEGNKNEDDVQSKELSRSTNVILNSNDICDLTSVNQSIRIDINDTATDRINNDKEKLHTVSENNKATDIVNGNEKIHVNNIKEQENYADIEFSISDNHEEESLAQMEISNDADGQVGEPFDNFNNTSNDNISKNNNENIQKRSSDSIDVQTEKECIEIGKNTTETRDDMVLYQDYGKEAEEVMDVDFSDEF